MPQYFQKETAGSPEQAANQAAYRKIGELTSNPAARNLQGNPLADFTSGGMSLEDVVAKYTKQTQENPYDPTKGPQIDYGQGPQRLSGAQAGALAQGKSITDVANMNQPQNAAVQAMNQAIAVQNQRTQEDALKQAYEQAKKIQPQAPQRQGEALPVVQQTISQTSPTQDRSSAIAQQMVTADPMIAQLQQMYTQYFQPQNQRQSLVQEYQNLLNASGIQGIDTELINMKNVIEGTEDDIRNEVMKAGGFATDSQVLALTNARNKQLVKNYNTLLETRNAKEKYLDTLMNLTVQDRAAMDAQFDRMMGFQEKMIEYRDKMETNARNAYQKVVDTIGYDGLYQQVLASGDTASLNKIESTLGLPSGGLLPLSILSANKRAKDEEKTALDLELKRQQIATEGAQRANIYAGIEEKKQKIATEGKKAEQRINDSVNKAEVVLGKIQQALPLVNGFTTGLVGQQLSKIGGTDAYNLKSTVDTIKANLGFDTLQAMRESSPTGGALGQVAVQELNMLQSTIASLDIAQDEPVLRQGFKDVQKHYENWLSTLGYSVAPDGTVIEITD